MITKTMGVASAWPCPVADPGFPVGGGVDPLGGGGRVPPTWALFGENVCENERIGSHGGRAPGKPPLDPPMLSIGIPVLHNAHNCDMFTPVRPWSITRGSCLRNLPVYL